MLRKYTLVIAVFMLAAFIFSACGASKSVTDSASPQTAMNEAAPAAARGGEFGFAEEAEYDTTTTERGQDNAPVKPKEDIKKIIKNGDIAVEVEDVDSSYQQIGNLVNSLGGEEFNKSYYASGQYKRMELVLKIPPEALDEFEDKLTELVGSGRIKSSNIRSQDITSQYYDISARLDSYTASRDQLRKLLEKAETVEDTLNIHRELSYMQAEIDALQGQITMWDKLVGMATITLYIDEIADPLRHTQNVGWRFSSFDDIWRTMQNGFISVVNTVYSIITWVVIIVISLIPVLIPVGIILWIVLRRRKKKKNNNNNPPLA